MRNVIVLFVIAAGCGDRVNPEFCCATVEQCAAAGESELRPCGPGQACAADNSCVAAQCESNAECDDSAPVCRLGYCESTCVADSDCADVTGRTRCGPDGTCVGCTDSSQCPANAAICDAEELTCRGCEVDNECASGVCLETQGTCADDANILYVGNGSDSGTCTKSAPCRTIGYAYSIVGLSSRNIIRVMGGAVSADPTTVAVNVAITIDGTSTMITKPAGTIPWLRVDQAGSVTLEGVTVVGPAVDDTNPSVGVGANATLIIGPGTDMIGTIRVENGTVRVERGQVSSGIACSNATVDIVDAIFASANQGVPQLGAEGCDVTVRRSRFSHVAAMIQASGGKVVVENSLFASKLEYADAVSIRNVQSESVFRFNTVVNTVQTDTGDGVALNCDASLDVSNNIFAYRSEHPFMYAPGCLAKYSVFDDVALPLPTSPIESSYHSFASLFENPVFGDFHLSSESPARNAADPNSTTTEDLEGKLRPRPAGTRADVGAYEAD